MEKLKELDVAALKEECATKIAQLKALDLIPSPFWEKERANQIKLLELSCQLKELTIGAYQNPELLKQFTLADSCFYYADALIEGGDALLAVWKEHAEKSCANNGASKWCMEKFLEMYNSPQRLEYARAEMMRYGWWNCANHHLPYPDSQEQREAEFKKEFKDIKFECDEP